jgi:hypothetical protein
LPKDRSVEVEIAALASICNEEKVSIGFERQPLGIDIFKGAVAFVFFIRLILGIVFCLHHSRKDAP